MNVNRRQFLKLAGGAALVATLPKALPSPDGFAPNTVTLTVDGVTAEDRVYATVIDAKGKPLSEVYEVIKHVTRRRGGELEYRATAELPGEFAGEQVAIYVRDTSKKYEQYKVTE